MDIPYYTAFVIYDPNNPKSIPVYDNKIIELWVEPEWTRGTIASELKNKLIQEYDNEHIMLFNFWEMY